MIKKTRNNYNKNIIPDLSQNENILLINQTAVAKKIKISQSYVSLLLSGKRCSKKYNLLIQNLIKKAAEELKTKAA